MQTKFASPIKGNNRGSSAKLVNYLEKENDKNISSEKEYFFSADRDKCNKWEVIQQIDNNAKGQKIEERQDRFYSIVIAPSQTELAHIGNDPEKLREYTRSVMENYASSFCDNKGNNRGLESKDLVWYAKVENERKYNALDEDVKSGISKAGELKEGDQRHIHIIVSRCEARENRHALGQENQQKKEQTTHLCPTVNNRKVFNRDEFIKANEKSFDKSFDYKRDIKESYEYCNAISKGEYQKQHEIEKEIKNSRTQQINFN